MYWVFKLIFLQINIFLVKKTINQSPIISSSKKTNNLAQKTDKLSLKNYICETKYQI